MRLHKTSSLLQWHPNILKVKVPLRVLSTERKDPTSAISPSNRQVRLTFEEIELIEINLLPIMLFLQRIQVRNDSIIPRYKFRIALI